MNHLFEGREIGSVPGGEEIGFVGAVAVVAGAFCAVEFGVGGAVDACSYKINISIQYVLHNHNAIFFSIRFFVFIIRFGPHTRNLKPAFLLFLIHTLELLHRLDKQIPHLRLLFQISDFESGMDTGALDADYAPVIGGLVAGCDAT